MRYFTTSFLPFLKKVKMERNALRLPCIIYARNHSLEHMTVYVVKMSLTLSLVNCFLRHTMV